MLPKNLLFFGANYTFNLLKTSPEYTRAEGYGKCVL